MNDYRLLFYLFGIIMVLVFLFVVWMFEFMYDEVENKEFGEYIGIIKEILILLFKF